MKRELRSPSARFKRRNYNRIPEGGGSINEPLTIEELEKDRVREKYEVKKRVGSDVPVLLDGAGARLLRYKSDSLVDSAGEERTNVSVYNTSIGRVEVNGSRVSERLRIDEKIAEVAGRKDKQLSTQRPMPSAHDHPTNTCKSKTLTFY